MTSLQGFLALLEQEYPDAKVRGKRFEPFLRDALLVSPSHQFKEVWCWDDWPGYDGPDRGIDLVAEDLDGGLWGIQSKLYGPDQSLGWGDLSTWVGTTRGDKWVGRLLVSTSPNLTVNAKKELLDDEKTLMLLGEDLFELPVEWPDTLRGKAKRVAALKPRKHQVAAIKAVCSALGDGAERVQVHMACGTGKTLVSLRIFEQVESGLTVVLVPSLSLMAQTIHSWAANAVEGFRYLPVCSDVKVAEDKRWGEDDDFSVDDLTSLDSGAIMVSPAANITSPKIPPSKAARFETAETIISFAATLDKDAELLVLFSAFTGLRAGECGGTSGKGLKPPWRLYNGP